LPLSVIIIGVGNGPFGNLEELHANKTELKNEYYSVRRNILHFVHFDKFKNDFKALSDKVL
jgi:Copine